MDDNQLENEKSMRRFLTTKYVIELLTAVIILLFLGGGSGITVLLTTGFAVDFVEPSSDISSKTSGYFLSKYLLDSAGNLLHR